MSKIAVRGGHNFLAIGAKALICETTEDRKVKDAVIKYLRKLGHDVLDVTPSNMNSDADLEFGVNKANKWGADIFISIHFNKAYTSYNGAIGTECWVVGVGGEAEKISNRICTKIASAGFKNRGTKVKGFYELRKTIMPAVIVEVCFVEATKDVELYKNVGVDKVGLLIAEGVANKKIAPDKPMIASKDGFYRVVCQSFKDRKNAVRKQNELKKLGFDSFLDFKNNYFRVVVGSFEEKSNAIIRVKELEQLGQECFLAYYKK